MNPALAQREIVLAGVALAAIVLALVIASLGDDGSSGASSDLPEAVPAPVEGGWYEALAAPYRVSRDAPTTACGHRADETTQRSRLCARRSPWTATCRPWSSTASPIS